MMQSVEEIRLNFINKLGTVWNKSEGEVEDLIKFDPVVRLLFNTIIFQYEDILNHHSEFKKEILIDLGKRLMPDYPVFARPSFGVISADSIRELPYKLKNDKVFSTPRKVKENVIEQKFIPVSDTILNPGNLETLIVNGSFIDIKAKQEGEEDYISKIDTIEDGIIWFGLSIPENVIDTIEKITLFINYHLDPVDNSLFFNEILDATWYFGNIRCKAVAGFASNGAPLSYSPNSSGLKLMVQKILDFYKKNFITLQIEDRDHNAISSPLLPEELQIKSKNTVWVSAKYNAHIPSSFLSEENIHFNAFPVMNCAVKEGNLTRNEIIKGVKLEENEFYLSLVDTDTSNSDEFVVRNARYKSFDTKDLSRELRSLSRLFSHSRALFDKSSNIEEKEMEVFREFSNIVSDIELRNKKGGAYTPDYIISSKKPFERSKYFKYLTTYGEYGNGGEAGDILKYEAPGLKAKSIKILIPFNGGENPLKEKNLVDKFRYQLLSRDRIVSHQDIIALCYSIFLEENIENVEIKKIAIQGLGNIGLQRAMKIEIHLKKSTKLNKKRIDFNKKYLLAQLENKSTGELPFLVEIVN